MPNPDEDDLTLLFAKTAPQLQHSARWLPDASTFASLAHNTLRQNHRALA